MTPEPDEALLWAKEMTDWSDMQDALAAAYRIGRAATEARIKELEEVGGKAQVELYRLREWLFDNHPDVLGAAHKALKGGDA